MMENHKFHRPEAAGSRPGTRSRVSDLLSKIKSPLSSPSPPTQLDKTAKVAIRGGTKSEEKTERRSSAPPNVINGLGQNATSQTVTVPSPIFSRDEKFSSWALYVKMFPWKFN